MKTNRPVTNWEILIKDEGKERLNQMSSAGKRAKKPAVLAAMVDLIKAIDVRKKMALIVFALPVLLAPVFHLMYRLFLAQDYPLLTGVAVSVMLALAITFNVIKSVAAMLKKINAIFYRLFEERFGNVQDLAGNDLIGDFQRTLYSMKVNLDLAQAGEDTAKVAQVNQAPGHVHTGVIVANNDFEYIYMNDSLLEIFKKAGSDSAAPLPDGRAESAYRHAGHQDQSDLNKPYRFELYIAGQVIRFSICSA